MKSLIRLNSVTYAIRAQKLLEQNGIRSYIRKITQNMNMNGCGFAVEVTGDVERAAQIIAAAGIRILSVSYGN